MSRSKSILMLLGLAVLVPSAANFAAAQTNSVSSALADGRVGEQADGYLGFPEGPSDALRNEVDAINIKRRAAYTDLAMQRGVTVKDVAATVGCETLKSRNKRAAELGLAPLCARHHRGGDRPAPAARGT